MKKVFVTLALALVVGCGAPTQVPPPQGKTTLTPAQRAAIFNKPGVVPRPTEKTGEVKCYRVRRCGPPSPGSDDTSSWIIIYFLLFQNQWFEYESPYEVSDYNKITEWTPVPETKEEEVVSESEPVFETEVTESEMPEAVQNEIDAAETGSTEGGAEVAGESGGEVGGSDASSSDAGGGGDAGGGDAGGGGDGGGGGGD